MYCQILTILAIGAAWDWKYALCVDPYMPLDDNVTFAETATIAEGYFDSFHPDQESTIVVERSSRSGKVAFALLALLAFISYGVVFEGGRRIGRMPREREKQLEDALEVTKSKITNLYEEKNSLESHINTIEAQLQGEKSVNNKVSSERDDLRIKSKKMEGDIKTKAGEVGNLKAIVEGHKQEIKDLEEKNTASMSRNSLLEAENKKLHTSLSELTELLNQGTRDVSRLELDLISARQDLALLQEMYNAGSTELSLVSKINDEQKQKIDGLEKQNKGLVADLTSLKTELDALHVNSAQLDGQLVASSQKVTDLQAAVEKWQKFDKDFADAEERRDGVEKQVRQLQVEKGNLALEISSLKVQLDSISKGVEQAQQQKKQADQEGLLQTSALRKSLKTLEEDLDRTKGELKIILESQKSEQSVLNDLREKVSVEASALQMAEGRLRSINESIVVEDGKLQPLKKSVDNLSQQEGELNERLGRLRVEIDLASEELQRLTTRISEVGVSEKD